MPKWGLQAQDACHQCICLAKFSGAGSNHTFSSCHGLVCRHCLASLWSLYFHVHIFFHSWIVGATPDRAIRNHTQIFGNRNLAWSLEANVAFSQGLSAIIRKFFMFLISWWWRVLFLRKKPFFSFFFLFSVITKFLVLTETVHRWGRSWQDFISRALSLSFLSYYST